MHWGANTALLVRVIVIEPSIVRTPRPGSVNGLWSSIFHYRHTIAGDSEGGAMGIVGGRGRGRMRPYLAYSKC